MALPKGERFVRITGAGRLVKMALFMLIVCASVFLCVQIISNSFSNQKNKTDFAELNHVKYGLFSVDEWKRQISVILAEEIGKLYLSGANERELRKHVEIQLTTLIDTVDRKIREANSGSAAGWVKQSFINVFVSLDDIKKGIPAYADSVIHEVTKAKTTDQIKTMLNSRLQDYFDQTTELRDSALLKRILREMETRDIETARIRLGAAIAAGRNRVFTETLILLYPSDGHPVFFVRLQRRTAGAVPVHPPRALPGPAADRRRDHADDRHGGENLTAEFCPDGYPIHFDNQILYFQSKSILDVFWIMITHKDPADESGRDPGDHVQRFLSRC